MVFVGYGVLVLVVLRRQVQATLHVSMVQTHPGRQVRPDNGSVLADQLRAFWTCYHTARRVPDTVETDVTFCPATFDGWGCWDATEAGHTATAVCSDSDPVSFVTKLCLPDGTWDTSDGEDNYTSCRFDLEADSRHLLFRILKELSKLEFSPYSHPQSAQAFEDCVDTVLVRPTLPDGDVYCSRTFDGWSCWNDTRAGGVAYVSCPSFIPGFLPERFAHKVCNEDGTWFRHPDTNKTWSNYTTCVDKEDLSFRQRINNLYIAGYSTSVIALLLSLAIFFYFKCLQCTRITIHKNLFISFIINNIMWIVWYTEVVRKPDVIISNEVACQMLHVLVHYFLVSNYFWMFCEGLYLHTLLVVAFVAEDKVMKWFYLLGWGTPLLIICIYGGVRKSYPEDTKYCWIEESTYLWIISGPVCISMLLNFVFLVNIVRVLVTKLRAVNSPDAHQTRKAVRATLILIPLLGLHYVVTPFRPEPRSPGEAFYETASAIVTSFQGLCVSLLFCFFNGEVIVLLRKKWGQALLTLGRDRRMSYATTTVSYLPRSVCDGKRQPRGQQSPLRYA